jgi:hypothetical protein
MIKVNKNTVILLLFLQSCTIHAQKFVGNYDLKHSFGPDYVSLKIEASGIFVCQHYSDVLGTTQQSGKWILKQDTLNFLIDQTEPPSILLKAYGSSLSSGVIRIADTLGAVFGAHVYVNGESKSLMSNIDGEVVVNVPVSEIKIEYLGNRYNTVVESQYSQTFEIFILSYKTVNSLQLPTKWQVAGRLLVPYNAKNETLRDAVFIRRKRNSWKK